MVDGEHVIIWIDDEAELLLSWADEFQNHNIKVLFVRTITRAKKELEEKYATQPLKGLLLDIMMPGVDPIIINKKTHYTENGHIAGLVFYNVWLKNYISEKETRDNCKIPIVALTNLSTPKETVDRIKESGLKYIVKSHKTITKECIEAFKNGK